MMRGGDFMRLRVDISAFSLKVLAIIGMTCNHAAVIFGAILPFPLECALMGAGGLTFPIMAFLLAEGYRCTSHVGRYALRLAVFACIAQLPFQLFLASSGNVLFTLLIGLGVLYARDRLHHRALFWAAAVLGMLISFFCDWGLIGIAMILINGILPQRKAALCSSAFPCVVVGLPALLSLLTGTFALLPNLLYALMCALAGFVLLGYRGRRGAPLKWFFYAYYPAHIVVLGIASMILFA